MVDPYRLSARIGGLPDSLLSDACTAGMAAPALVWFVLAFVLPLDVPRRSAFIVVIAACAAALLSAVAFLYSGLTAFLIALACNILILAVTVLPVFRSHK